MNEVDAREATPIVERMMNNLSTAVPSVGRPGSDARAAIGDVKAEAYILMRKDELGPLLNNAFIAVKLAGATYQQIEYVRRQTALENPFTLGARLVTNSGIDLCLATEAEIIANMTFVSRQDVDVVKELIKEPFQDAIEEAADDMDQFAFQTITHLYGALTNHLVSTARPLPRIIGYRFAKTLPSLVLAYRLYADASRGDEIRGENKIVHPAFCPLIGVALSA